MIWDFVRISLIFFSHAFTLPLMNDAKPKIKRSLPIWCATFLFLEVVSALVLRFFGVFDVVSGGVLLVVSFVTYQVVAALVWEGPLLKSFFMFITYCVYYMFAADISLSISYLPSIPYEYSGFVMSFCLSIMSIIYAFLLHFGVREYLRALFEGIRKGWGILVLFSIAVFVVVAFLVMLSLFYVISDFRISLIVFAMLFVIVTSAYGIVLQTIRLLKDRNEESRYIASEKLLRSEIDAERRIIDSARRFRHDMRHHNNMILEYLDRGDAEGAMEYIRKYDSTLDSDNH